VRGVLAGNKFDLGARDTLELHAKEGIDFFKTLEELGPRPWFADDVDELTRRLAPAAVGKTGSKERSSGRRPYRKAMYFVDNAGGDVVLGAIPFARFLARHDCHVVLAANDYPALNDVLLPELNELLAESSAYDTLLAQQLAEGRVSTIGTGCDCPLIDLSEVSEACNEAAAGCDLIILEGMGRAVETNYSAEFDCDVIRLAMIKNRVLAAHMNCKLYDLIARFTPAA
jgi:type II pantothenate kinase